MNLTFSVNDYHLRLLTVSLIPVAIFLFTCFHRWFARRCNDEEVIVKTYLLIFLFILSSFCIASIFGMLIHFEEMKEVSTYTIFKSGIPFSTLTILLIYRLCGAFR